MALDAPEHVIRGDVFVEAEIIEQPREAAGALEIPDDSRQN
jgi:hypothetical protein